MEELPEDHNAPKVFMKRMIDNYCMGDTDALNTPVSSQLVSALLLLKDVPGAQFAHDASQNVLKENMYYTIFNSDGSDFSEAVTNLQSARTQVMRSKILNLAGFYEIYLEGEKHPIPATIHTNPFTGRNADKLRLRLYKDNLSRVLDIPIDKIERIVLVTLVTLRGFKRAQKYKAKCVKHLDDTAVAFNTDDI